MRTGLSVGFLAAALATATAAEAADTYASRTSARYVSRSDLAYARGYTGALPSCADPAVVARVAHGFSGTEREYWRSGLELSPFVKIRELGYRSWGQSFIPRRFCSAHVVTTDGRRREVVYNIRERQAFASLGWGVEWCVTGLDRSYSYAPGCKMARP